MPNLATTLLASLLLFRPFRKLAQRWHWLLALVTTAAAGQGWQPGFHCPGLNNYVTTVVALPNGDLIAGGSFTNAGGHPAADYIAQWDGRTWQALGTGLLGINNSITALVAAPDGTVFATGTRLDSSGVYGLVARWDGRRWQQLGPAMRGSWISTLAVAANGDLLAGTNNPAVGCGVLRWQGQAWQPLAPNAPAGSAMTPPASTITQLATTPTGDILAVGRFATTSHSCTEVARWTGSAWLPLRATDPNVCGITSLAVAANGDLLGSTSWYKHDGTLGRYRCYVARWNGHDWQQLGADLPSAATRLLTTATGRIVVNCVAYPDYGASRATTLASWDGTRWRLQYLGKEGVSAGREALALAANGDIIVRDPIYSLTRWDGRRWHALADEQSVGFPGTYHAGRVTALALAPNRDVLLAGLFYPDTPDTLAPHLAHLQVCRWDGRRRHYLGTALSGTISTVAVAANGEVLIGGQFKVPGAPDSLCHVAHWDGQRWQHLGADLSFTVNALAVAPNGDVVAGGREGPARWDGHQWQLLPLPFPSAGALNYI
jgi:hypothetical protein